MTFKNEISLICNQNLNKLQIMSDALKDIQYFTTSLASVFTIFTVWRTAKLTYYIRQKKSIVRKLQSSELLSVEELKDRGLKVNEVVIVRGNAGTKDGKEVEKNEGWGKKQKIAIDLKFTQAIYSNDSFKKENYILNMNEALKSCIVQGSTKITLYSQNNQRQKSTILLKNFDQKDYSRVLQILNWEQKKRSLTLVEHINVILLGLLRAIVMIGSQGKDGEYLRGIEIGKREVQAGLKVGASVSVLGTISLTLDGQFVLDAQRIFKDRLSQITNIKDQIESLIEKRNIWLLGSVIGVIYLGRRGYKYCKQHKIKIPFIGQI